MSVAYSATGVTLHHGDSRDILATFPALSFDAIVTDPPYGTGTGDAIYGRRGEGKVNSIANDRDLAELIAIAPEMTRLLQPTGVAVAFCAPQKRSDVESIIRDGGLTPLHSAPWDKGAPGISYRVRYAYEDAVIAAHPDYDPWETREPLVVPMRHSRVLNPRHPNEKPVPLLRQIIRWALPNGGTVLDPFAGVASCGVAAMMEHCAYVGVELDDQWLPVAIARLMATTGHTGDLPLFDTPPEDVMSPKSEHADEKVFQYLQKEAASSGRAVVGNLRRIGAATGVAPGTVWSALQRLAAAGKTERAEKVGRSDAWRVVA